MKETIRASEVVKKTVFYIKFFWQRQTEKTICGIVMTEKMLPAAAGRFRTGNSGRVLRRKIEPGGERSGRPVRIVSDRITLKRAEKEGWMSETGNQENHFNKSEHTVCDEESSQKVPD